MIKAPFSKIHSHAILFLTGWTIIIAVLMVVNLKWAQHTLLNIAETEATTGIQKDLLYRRWNSSHGGVYVPVDENTPPNPYLSVPDREIYTPSGKLLTLMNPAYMNRQVFAAQDASGTYAHLTSLNPLNPENEPDTWEKEALRTFETGTTAVTSVEIINDEEYIRLMIPFITEESCLKCHASQGYKVGDVRGGLSTSIPLSKYAHLERSNKIAIVMGYGSTWLVGMAGILWAFSNLRQSQREREKIFVSLQEYIKKLEASEDKFSKLFQFSPAMVTLSTPENDQIVDVNNRFLDGFGFTREEVIGRSSSELGLFATFEREKLIENFQSFGNVKDAEVIFHKKDGTRMDCIYNGEMLYLHGKRYLLSLAQDITAQKQVEEQLRENENSLKFSQEIAHVGHWTWDTQTNRVVWSEEMYRVFGLDPEAFDGDLDQVIARAIHPEDRDKVNRSNEAVLTESRPAPMEYRVIWPDQSVHTIWAVPGGKVTDENGQIIKLTGIVQDITERKQVEETLLENQKLLLQAQQVADLGYYQMDIHTGLWTSSEILDHIFGIDKEFVRSVEGWASIIHPDDRDSMVAYFTNEVLGKKENFDREYKIIRMNDRAARWVHGLGELQSDPQGNVVRMIGTIQDITERRRGEELLRLSESRFRTLFEEMMDGFALHEIICDDSGTPVNYRFLAVNPAFEKLTGLRAADIVNKTVLEVMPQTEKVWIERYGRVALSGEPDHFEDFSAALSTYYEVRAFSPAQNQFAVAFHDISQRKHSENITMARVKIVEIATTHSLDELLQTILDEAETLTGSCIGFYHFLESDQKTINLQNWSTRTMREFCHATGKGMHYPVDKAGVWVDCVHTKKPVIHNDYGALTHRKGLPPGHAEIVRELVVPVMRGDKIVAILGVGNKRSDYTQHDIDIVQQLAELAIEIVERKRSEQEVVEKNAELAALFSISAHLRTATSANEMMPVVLREVRQALNADANAVILLEPGEDNFLFALADGVLAPNTGSYFGVTNSISGRIMKTREPYATTDFANDTNRCSAISNFEGLGPAVLVPLQSETEFIGCLLCARDKNALKGEFSAGEIQLLASIGEMVGTALRRARLYDDALLRLRRVQGLHTIDVAMSSNMDLNVTLYILLNQSLSLMEVDAVDILTFNPVIRTLNYTVGRGFRTNYMEHVQLRLGEGIAGRAALERRAIAVTDLSSETNISRADIFKKEGFQSIFIAPMITKGQMRGVIELYSRRKFNPNAEWMEFLEALASQTAIAMDAAQLYNELQRSNFELSMAYDATIEGWSHALDLKDKETEGHTLRVTNWTIRLAALAGIAETEIVHLRRGALLHDIGKLGIPDQILGKTGKLTEEEWETMRQHTVYGYNMLYPIEFLRPAIDIPYCHHEKWDGTGYPQGLAGEQIPYAARLFAIVDVWDAITSDRPYRKAWSFETALEHIRSERGKQFDPAIVDLFLKLVDELKTTHRYQP